MKKLYARLLLAQALLLLLLLTGLGIVLSQFFPLFAPEINSTIHRRYLFFLVIVLIAAFILSFFIAARMMYQYAKPIDQATRTALRIAKGDFMARTAVMEPGHDNELSLAINVIGRNMQEMSILRDRERERLKTLIESMGSGLLMFGRGGTVNLVNGVFCKKFGFTKEEVVGKMASALRLPKEIESLIEGVFMTEQVHEKQVRLNDNGSASSFSVYGAPVIDNHGSWLGIVVVMHDITKLVRLEQVRKDFVANVSHELRTPITSIKGFTETLRDGAMDDPIALKEFLEIIQKESDRLQLLIDDLLELSNVEREGFSLQFAPVHLNKVMARSLQAIAGNLERKEMTVHFDLLDDIVIEGDESRLIQVMVNLLSNAVTYSQNDKTINITIEKLETDVLIVVEDEGIGIETSELPRLFERFYRVDRARSRNSGGTGLGLAIVKHLIEAHHGAVDVKSTPGLGTTFSIRLPIQQ